MEYYEKKEKQIEQQKKMYVMEDAKAVFRLGKNKRTSHEFKLISESLQRFVYCCPFPVFTGLYDFFPLLLKTFFKIVTM